MRRLAFILCSLTCSLSAFGQTNCTPDVAVQSDSTPQVAAAAKALAATNPCKLLPGYSAKSLATVWASLLQSTRTGGRRLETPLPAGTPQGLVLPENNAVHFDFSTLAEQPLLLRVEVDQKPLLTLSRPPLQIDLPVGNYGPDPTFTWTLTTARGAYRAEFRLMPAADRKEVEARLAALGSGGLDPVSALIYKAAVYDESDLYAQRDGTFLLIRRTAGF